MYLLKLGRYMKRYCKKSNSASRFQLIPLLSISAVNLHFSESQKNRKDILFHSVFFLDLRIYQHRMVSS
jgi:hypothetical protein